MSTQSSPVRLTNREVGELRDLLRAAFGRSRFEELLMFRLDRQLDDYAGTSDDYPTALRKVVTTANSQLWWRDLIVEARAARPADPDLQAFGERFGLAPSVHGVSDGDRALELVIKRAGYLHDIASWRAKLGEIEGRVCRVEVPGGGFGTGFLVGPDVVLTNHHVVESAVKAPSHGAQIALRFDYKRTADGTSIQAGTVHRLADDWLVDASPPSRHDWEASPTGEPNEDELDYALLRLATPAGDEPVGGPTGDPDAVSRGWIALPDTDYDFSSSSALYIAQHPRGAPLKVALDTEAVVGVNPGGTRVRYTTSTEPGSSGSPCFSPDWEWVALHHSGDPLYYRNGTARFNQGIPTAAIQRLMRARGTDQAFGV